MTRSSLNLSKDHVNSAVITDYAYADLLIKDKFNEFVRLVDMESKSKFLPPTVHVYLKSRKKLGMLSVNSHVKKAVVLSVKQHSDQRCQRAMLLAKAFIERHILK